jgi:galactonate dehydratase
VGVAPHISEGPVDVAALVHIDATTPNFLIQEFFYPDLSTYEEILTEPFPIPKDGFIELPTRPSLEIEINEKALTKKTFEYRPRLELGVFWKGGITAFGKPAQD